MAKRVISAAWDDALADLKRDGRTYLIVALALIMLPFTLLGLIDPEQVKAIPNAEHDPTTLTQIVELLTNLSGLVAQIAIIALVLPSGDDVGGAIKRGLRLMFPVIAALIIMLAPFLIALFLLIGSAVGFENLLSGTADPFAGRDIGLATSLLLLAVVVLMLFVVVRASLFMSVAVAEKKGPVAMLRRSWQLTDGYFWRLFGFLLLFGFAMIVLLGSVGLVVGIIVSLVFGAPEPFSAGALLIGLAAGFTQAVTGLASAVIMANIYKRLSAPTEGEAVAPA